MTNLLEAARTSNVSRLLKRLREGDSPDFRDDNGETALHKAASQIYQPADMQEIIRILLDSGANTEAKTEAGDTVLLSALKRRCYSAELVPIIKILLDRGANVNAQAPCGSTPLHLAAKATNPTINGTRCAMQQQLNTESSIKTLHNGSAIITLLLQAGADRTIRDRVNNTAADYALLPEVKQLVMSFDYAAHRADVERQRRIADHAKLQSEVHDLQVKELQRQQDAALEQDIARLRKAKEQLQLQHQNPTPLLCSSFPASKPAAITSTLVTTATSTIVPTPSSKSAPHGFTTSTQPTKVAVRSNNAYAIPPSAVPHWTTAPHWTSRPAETACLPRSGTFAMPTASSAQKPIAHIVSTPPAKDEKSCVVCFEGAPEVVFINCGHLVCCQPCGSRMTNCPVCRAKIQSTVKVFQ